MEQMTTLRDLVGQVIQKKEEEKRIAEEQAAKDRYWKIPICYDDDEDDTIAITPVLPIEEPDNSLREGIPDKMCDVPLCENTTPLNALNEHSEIVANSDDDNSSSDDDSTYGEDIEYVDASPPDVEIVSLEVVEIVDPEVGRIDDDILLTIKDDILREKLLNVNLLIAKIDSLRDNPIPSSEGVIKSTSTFPNLFLEETNTFDNSIPESETFCFNLEEISSGSPTTHSELSLPDYKAFYVDNDHFKERSSGSTTTHVDFSQYDSFIFDLSNDQFPPAGRSDFNHEEFADELTHIMSLPELECFKFKIEPDPGDLTSIDPGIRKNVSTTNVNVPLEDDQSSLFAYVVWIFLAFLTYPVDFPDCEDSRACSIHMSFTSSASFWESRLMRALLIGIPVKSIPGWCHICFWLSIMPSMVLALAMIFCAESPPWIYKIYDKTLRTKALSIVYSCTSMLGVMSGVYKTETSALMLPLVKFWMVEISSILEIPVQSQWWYKVLEPICLAKFPGYRWCFPDVDNLSALSLTGIDLCISPIEVKYGEWALKVVTWIDGQIISLEHIPNGEPYFI
ncbi:hypothetical protein Tco_1253554 [Tanacetum coccineum]